MGAARAYPVRAAFLPTQPNPTMKPLIASKLVWLNVPDYTVAGSSIRFPDIPELSDKRITGIEFYNIAMLAATPDQVAVITAADALGATLTLKENSTERVQDIPLATMLPTNVGGIWKEFVPFVVNWQASVVRFTTTPATLPCAVPFNIFYEEAP